MKRYTVLDWCEIFGIELFDNDGFSELEIRREVSLERFVEGIVQCTIRPFNVERYSVLKKLW